MKKILVVDDDQDLSESIQAILQYQKYEVLLSNDPKEAGSIIKNHDLDLIIMDVMMPGMDGVSLVRHVHAELQSKHIPVLFLTGLLAKTDVKLSESGIIIDDLLYPSLAKPFEIDELLKEVQVQLKQR